MSYTYWDFEQEATANRQRSSVIYQDLDDAGVISAFGSTEVAGHCHPVGGEAEESLARHQAQLPRLPVPPLQTTCDLYLKSVAALSNMEEYEATEAAVNEFRKPDGVGETLQKLLEQHNHDCNRHELVGGILG